MLLRLILLSFFQGLLGIFFGLVTTPQFSPELEGH
jgi:hypothetical protein